MDNHYDALETRPPHQREAALMRALAAQVARAQAEAPAFATIARKPDFDVNRMTAFLLNPYPRMPKIGRAHV